MSTYDTADTEQVTVKQVFDALAENGFQHLRRTWFAEDVTGVITGGCVIQQGAMNLGVVASGGSFAPYSLAAQLDTLPVAKNSKWYTAEARPVAGQTIIHWNDKRGPDSHYKLRTYKAVIKMAKEILEPHFEKKLTLKKREWKYRKIADTPVVVGDTSNA